VGACHPGSAARGEELLHCSITRFAPGPTSGEAGALAGRGRRRSGRPLHGDGNFVHRTVDSPARLA